MALKRPGILGRAIEGTNKYLYDSWLGEAYLAIADGDQSLLRKTDLAINLLSAVLLSAGLSSPMFVLISRQEIRPWGDMACIVRWTGNASTYNDS